jgi:peptide/nickel transport system substrate-binding protein
MELLLLVSVSGFSQEIPRGGTIVLPYRTEPRTFDPMTFDDSSVYFINLLFSGLVTFDNKDLAIPVLAEKWEVSPNGLIWTFHLRKNVLFHDGTELTADDVVATYKAAAVPSSNSSIQNVIDIIQGFQAPDRYTFLVILNKPYAPLLSLMQYSIVPARLLADKQYMEKEFSKNPIGAGPFRLSKQAPGEITFTAFDRYFGGKPFLDSVIFRLIPEQKKAWTSFMQGEIDIMMDLDSKDFEVIRKDSRFKSYADLDYFNYMILFNMNDPLLSQKSIRQAFSMAIDRQDIIDKSFPNGGVPSSGPFRPDTWPYNPSAGVQQFYPQQARKTLADLGWKDTDGDWILDKGKEKLGFTLIYDEGDAVKELAAKRIQWQLLQVGVRVDVEALPQEDFLENRLFPGKFQAALIQFNTAGDPDLNTSTFWHSNSIGKFNFAAYRNPDVDKMIEEGRNTSGQEKRTAIYQKINDLISDDAPAIYLFYKKRFAAASQRIGGIQSGFQLFNTESIGKFYIIGRK